MQQETKFKERVLKYLEELKVASKGMVWYLKTQEVSRRGVPDILCCIRGHFFAMELKRSSKEEPDPLQQYNLQQIKMAGGHSYWVHPENWVRMKRILRNFSRGIYDET